MKRYAGHRTPRGAVVTVATMAERGAPARLAPLPQIVYHSPTGFEWGYPGSGPSDLALALLVDHLGEDPVQVETRLRTGPFGPPCARCAGEGWLPAAGGDTPCAACAGTGLVRQPPSRALALHHRFLWDVVCRLDRQAWTLTDTEIAAWLAAHPETGARDADPPGAPGS